MLRVVLLATVASAFTRISDHLNSTAFRDEDWPSNRNAYLVLRIGSPELDEAIDRLQNELIDQDPAFKQTFIAKNKMGIIISLLTYDQEKFKEHPFLQKRNARNGVEYFGKTKLCGWLPVNFTLEYVKPTPTGLNAHIEKPFKKRLMSLQAALAGAYDLYGIPDITHVVPLVRIMENPLNATLEGRINSQTQLKSRTLGITVQATELILCEHNPESLIRWDSTDRFCDQMASFTVADCDPKKGFDVSKSIHKWNR